MGRYIPINRARSRQVTAHCHNWVIATTVATNGATTTTRTAALRAVSPSRVRSKARGRGGELITRCMGNLDAPDRLAHATRTREIAVRQRTLPEGCGRRARTLVLMTQYRSADARR